MADPTEAEMMADLQAADAAGDTQLAQHIAGKIKAARTPPKPGRSGSEFTQQLGEGALPGFNRVSALTGAALDPVVGLLSRAKTAALEPYSVPYDPNQWGEGFGERYQNRLRALQGQSERTRGEAPWTAGTLNAVGSIPSAVLAGPGPKAADVAGQALSRSQRAWEAAKQGFGFGSAYGAGSAPADAGVGPVAAHTVGGGILGAAVAAPIGALMPAHNPAAAARAQLLASDEAEKKAAERGLQALSGSKFNARRAARALAQEDAALPTQVGKSVWREGEAAGGYRTADELADALSAAEQEAGKTVGGLYGAHTKATIPVGDPAFAGGPAGVPTKSANALTPGVHEYGINAGNDVGNAIRETAGRDLPPGSVRAAVEPSVASINAPSTRAAHNATSAYLDDAIETMRRLSAERAVAENPEAWTPAPRTKVSPADIHWLRKDLDTKARGWAGLNNPQDTAGASALNQSRGRLNAEVLHPAMEALGVGPEAKIADAEFRRLTNAAFLAEKLRAGDLFGEEGGVAQLERLLKPAGSLVARSAAGLGPAAESAAGLASMAQKATVNNPRWNQFAGRRAFQKWLELNATPLPMSQVPPTGATSGAAANDATWLANALRRLGRPGLVPAGADEESSK